MTSPRVGVFQYALTLYALAGELRKIDPLGASMADEVADRIFPAMTPQGMAFRRSILADHGGDVSAAARAALIERGWPCNP